jgi:hypothetical protein
MPFPKFSVMQCRQYSPFQIRGEDTRDRLLLKPLSLLSPFFGAQVCIGNGFIDVPFQAKKGIQRPGSALDKGAWMGVIIGFGIKL